MVMWSRKPPNKLCEFAENVLKLLKSNVRKKRSKEFYLVATHSIHMRLDYVSGVAEISTIEFRK